MKDLVLLDPKTGERENCGIIAQKREVGGVTVYLTFTEPVEPADGDEGMWWIVWQDGRLRLHKMGYVVERREICWQTFTDLDEAELARLRPS